MSTIYISHVFFPVLMSGFETVTYMLEVMNLLSEKHIDQIKTLAEM